MVSIKGITGGAGGLLNKVLKFALSGILGGFILFIGVNLLGPFLGGLIGGSVLSAMGEPTLGSVVAFDAVLSLFLPGGL